MPSDIRWLIDDRPRIVGTVSLTQGTLDLAGVTFRLATPSQISYPETLGEVSGATVSINWPLEFERTEAGKILVSVFASEASAEFSDIDGAEFNVTDIVGTIPPSGHLFIGKECISYTYANDIITIVERGLFGSPQQVHVAEDAVKFSSLKETCTPYYTYRILEQDDTL